MYMQNSVYIYIRAGTGYLDSSMLSYALFGRYAAMVCSVSYWNIYIPLCMRGVSKNLRGDRKGK